MMLKKKLLYIGALLLCLLAAFLAGLSLPQATALSDKIYKSLETFTRIIEIVDKQYVEPVDEEELIEGAIRGMLSSLDPHTVYLPPRMYKDFKSDTTGKFGGIGIEITIRDDVLTVVSPIEDSPAFKAGIQSGDKIVKINGKSTKGMSLIEAVQKMRGPRGKKVTITIFRKGVRDPFDVTLTRAIIKVTSIKYEDLGDGLGYIRITSFQEKTANNLKKALKKLEEEMEGSLRGIILDLRNNPGGLLSEAVRVSDIFMSKGVIVSTKGRHTEEEVRKAHKNGSYAKLPVVVLVNGGSASAAEIVAGALQDSRRAKVMGTTSFGKGSVQTILDMGDKSALKITIAKYYTPKGRSIEGRGINPDILVSKEQWEKAYPKKEGEKRPTFFEYQKEKAIAYLRKITSS